MKVKEIYLKEILRLRCKGYSNKDIHKMTKIGRNTICHYMLFLKTKEADPVIAKIVREVFP